MNALNFKYDPHAPKYSSKEVKCFGEKRWGVLKLGRIVDLVTLISWEHIYSDCAACLITTLVECCAGAISGVMGPATLLTTIGNRRRHDKSLIYKHIGLIWSHPARRPTVTCALGAQTSSRSFEVAKHE